METDALVRLALGFGCYMMLTACGSGETKPASSGAAADASQCAAAPEPTKLGTACDVAIASPPVPQTSHVPEGSPLTFCSNPPSGGNHYPVWANFQEYDKPIDWGYLVHSMEHGAVVLLYRCEADSGPCTSTLELLRRVRDEAAADPLCPGGGKRIIIAPSPTITSPVAAAAWGRTYTASCVDVPTLSAFVRDNYNKGPENICAPGSAM